MDIPQKLVRIVEKYENTNSQLLNNLKLQSDFVEPFFQLLGWKIKLSNNNLSIEPEVKKINKVNETYPEYLFKTLNY
ncbi:MAG: hypothetical protein KAS18_11320, partial [Calditrichia bacterium]|nr:hypothetical protein [Calditrichia bacterium]